MIPDFERISAGFLVQDRKVFVAQRDESKDMPLKWEFPGGKLNENEKYDEALIREFNEEFDMSINVLKEIGGAELNQKNKVLIVMFFLIEGDINNINLKHHKEYKFVTISELLTLDLSDADKNFTERYKSDLSEYID